MSAIDIETLSGLEGAKRALRGLMRHESATHAVLLHGLPGSGKRTLASFLTKSWLCQSPLEGQPCGECRACLAFDRGNAVDVLTIAPWSSSRWIKLSAIVDGGPRGEDDPPFAMLPFVRTPPMMARNKVVVIHDVDRLYHAAASPLLKTLEEPPARVRFVLTTSERGQVRSTILSRCVVIGCSVPSKEENSDVFKLMPGWGLGVLEREPWKQSLIEKLSPIARSLAQGVSANEVLVVSEQIRNIAEGFNDKAGGARLAVAETLSILGDLLSLEPNAPASARYAIAEAHRRVLGNVSSGLVIETMLMAMIFGSKEPRANGMP